MAIGAGNAGAWAAVNATTQTVTLPTHAAGTQLILVAACKAATPASVNIQITTPATGWEKVASFADGTTASGTGTGSVTTAIFRRICAASGETNPVVTWGGSQTAAPGIAVAVGFTKAAGEVWLMPAVEQKATNAATSISVTMNANPGITAGDWGVIAHTTADDSALTVPTWTATSATLGTAVVYPATPIASTTSNDMAGTAAYRAVTSGTASAAPVVTGTQAAAETGVTSFIRLRVATAAAQSITVPPAVGGGVGTSYDTEVTADTPEAFWTFGDSSGNPQDSAGTNHVTVVGGTPTYGVTGAVADGSTAIRLDRASSEYFTVPDHADLDVGDGPVTIEFIAKRATAGIWAQVFDKTGASPSFGLYFYTDNLLHAELHGVGDWVTSTSADTDTSAFHHWVVTKNANSDSHIYRDGTDVTGTTTNRTLVDNTGAMFIGSYITSGAPTAGSYFDGTLQKLAIYKSVLSPTRVSAHYAAISAVGGLALTTFAPTVTAGAGTVVTPTTATLVATKYAPTIKVVITPTTKALTLTRFIPQARTPILATPAAVSLTATKFAPTVTATANQRVTPTTATLTATKYAPTVTTPERVTPTTSSLALATFAATVSVPVRATPITKALTLTGFVPPVSATAHQTVTPPAAALTLTKFAPTLSAADNQVVTPAVKSLTVTRFAPTVSATAHVAVTGITKSLVIASFAPTVAATAHQTLVPTAVSLQLNEQVPTVSFTAHQTITVPKATLTLTAYAPSTTQTNDQVAIPTTRSLTLTRLTPTVTATAHVAVIPTTKAVAITRFAPTVRTPILVTPAIAALVVTMFAPAARAPILATPAKKILTLATFQATVRTTVLVTPSTKALALTAYAPTIVNPQRFVPSTTALTITRHVPIAQVGYRVTPTTKALTTARFAPVIVITAHQFAIPTTRALTLTAYAPQLAVSDHRLVVVTTATLTLTTFVPLVRTTGDLLPHLLIGTITQRPSWSAELTVIAESGGSSITSDSHAGVITK